MTESRLRRQVIDMLRPLDAISIENSVYPGTPDVNFIEGWIELKKVPAWPKGRKTVLKIEHFTPQQRAWLLRRRYKHGCVLLLLQVEREWLLFQGDIAALHVGKCAKQELIDWSEYHWKTKPSPQEFLNAIENFC